jgi:hypothetical protein
MLASLSRANQNLDFNNFVRLIEQISVKIFPKQSEEAAFRKLVEDFFIHLDNEIFSLSNVETVEEKMNMI